MSKETIYGLGGALAGSNRVLGALFNNNFADIKKSYLTIDDEDKASAKIKNSKITANYNTSDDEKSLLDYTNKELLNSLKNANIFSDEIQQNFQNQLDAYKRQGVRTLNDTYTPMFRELKADIASRFGNLDNSIFLDNLNEIEKNRTNALETLTENILAKQTELYEKEMNNRFNYIDRLASTNKELNENILNYLKLASSNTKG